MLDTHEKFRLQDLDKKGEWFIEVNWNPKDSKTNECKILRITHPNGDITYLAKEHLNSVLFAIGNAAEQREMIPQTLTTNRHYNTIVSVKAKKDIHKGEEITFPLSLTLPVKQEEVIGSIKQQKSNLVGAGNKLVPNKKV